jgi:site-specific DNA recombinase
VPTPAGTTLTPPVSTGRPSSARSPNWSPEHRAKTGELARLAGHQSEPGPPDPGLLAALPQLSLRLAGLPEQHLQRSLYDACQLQVRYHRRRHEVTIRVTMRADSLNHIKGTVNAIKSQGAAEKKTETGSHVLSAPSRIRTYAPGSGGRCSIP